MHCVSIEHKLGIHASPTAVMAFGDNGGAIGYLVGEENRGLEYMFIMMNAARFSVGLEGVAIAERAYQRALAYARERVQGKAVGVDGRRRRRRSSSIPDVRRMLMTMKCADRGDARARLRHRGGAGHRAPPSRRRRARKQHQAFVDLMIPIVKGWCTETAHRGRVARRAGARRHGLHRGDRRRAVLARRAHHHDLRRHHRHPGQRPGRPQDRARRRRDGQGADRGRCKRPTPSWRSADERRPEGDPQSAAAASKAVDEASTASSRPMTSDVKALFAGAVPFLKLMGIVSGGWQMARAALVAKTKLAWTTAATIVLPGQDHDRALLRRPRAAQAPGLRHTIVKGAAGVMALAERPVLQS